MEKDKVDTANISDEATKGILISTFIASASLFFSGLLIARLDNLSEQIKVPLLFLFTAVVSMTFSAIIYANVTGELNRGQSKNALHYLQLGNVLSEFLGVYNFIAALPLVLIIITPDNFIRGTACVLAIGGLALYTATSTSLIHRYSPVLSKLHALFLIILLGAMVMFYVNGTAMFKILGFGYILHTVLLAILTKQKV